MSAKKSTQKKKATQSKVSSKMSDKVDSATFDEPTAVKQPTSFTPETLGSEASMLLENEIFVLALNYVESSALRECRYAKTAEESYRGTLKSQAIQDIRSTLHAYIAQGEAAAEAAYKYREELERESEEEKLYKTYLTAAKAAREEADSQHQSHLNGSSENGRQ